MKLKKVWNEDYTKKAVFILTVLTCAVIIIAILYNMPVIAARASDFISWVISVLNGFIAGFVLAYLLAPVVGGLQKLIMRIKPLSDREKIARGLAIAVTYIIIFGVFIAGLMAVIFAITKQVTKIDFAQLPDIIQQLQIQIYGFVDTITKALENYGIDTGSVEDWLSSVGTSMSDTINSAGTSVFGFAGNVTSFLSNFLFAIIFSVYFLFDTDGLIGYWSDAFKALLGKKVHGVLAVLLDDADKCFSGYIRGQFADAVFMAVAVSVVLAIVGVPYAVVIGILTGIGNLIPYVGPFVAYGLTLAVCIASGKWTTLVIALILIFILQTIDGNVINPRLLSQSIDVHPVLIIVALLFGSAIGGFMGMLLAVPVASFIKIQFERLIEYRKRSAG